MIIFLVKSQWVLFLDSAICKNNTLCCCHGRQLFVEDHPHHALHPASNSLARLSSLVRLTTAAAFGDLNVAHYSIFRKKSSYSSSPRLDPDPYTPIAHIICNFKKTDIFTDETKHLESKIWIFFITIHRHHTAYYFRQLIYRLWGSSSACVHIYHVI